MKDGATVPVYLEPRLIKVGLARDITQEGIESAADETTTGLDDPERARIEQYVAVVNAVYGASECVKTLDDEIVRQWESRRVRMRSFIKLTAGR